MANPSNANYYVVQDGPGDANLETDPSSTPTYPMGEDTFYNYLTSGEAGNFIFNYSWSIQIMDTNNVVYNTISGSGVTDVIQLTLPIEVGERDYGETSIPVQPEDLMGIFPSTESKRLRFYYILSLNETTQNWFIEGECQANLHYSEQAKILMWNMYCDEIPTYVSVEVEKVEEPDSYAFHVNSWFGDRYSNTRVFTCKEYSAEPSSVFVQTGAEKQEFARGYYTPGELGIMKQYKNMKILLTSPAERVASQVRMHTSTGTQALCWWPNQPILP